ncbi:MAG: hypothetical protein ACQESK_09880 [Bacteroidota bacterium]
MAKKIFLLLFFLIPFTGIAQQIDQAVQSDSIPIEQPPLFDENVLADLSQESDYDYAVSDEISPYEAFKNWINLKWNQLLNYIFDQPEAGTILYYFIKFLPYFILLIIIAVIARWFYIRNFGSKILAENKQTSAFNFSEEEEIIRKKDIDELIQQAVKNQNYRLAIRYHYLKTLKQLEKNELIKYDFSKTNQDYFQEIEQENFKNQFQKLTHFYDFAWYGGFSIASPQYDNISVLFHQFSKELEKISSDE